MNEDLERRAAELAERLVRVDGACQALYRAAPDTARAILEASGLELSPTEHAELREAIVAGIWAAVDAIVRAAAER